MLVESFFHPLICFVLLCFVGACRFCWGKVVVFCFFLGVPWLFLAAMFVSVVESFIFYFVYFLLGAKIFKQVSLLAACEVSSGS